MKSLRLRGKCRLSNALRLLILAALFSIGTGRALAATYYVSTTGNDSGDGSLLNPWRTIRRGVAQLSPGDTLLIRGTGRTDFQNGSAHAQYESLFGKLLKLPEETLVFPAHDYKGDMVSTIGEEKRHNPRLQVKSVDEYVDLMSKLNLPNPKMMDVAVPANLRQGLAQDDVARKGWALSAVEAITLLGSANAALVDLREQAERDKHGSIPGSLHAPYADLADNIRRGGILYELACATGKRLVFYCAFGERSAMAVQAAQDAGLTSACHIHGGITAWRQARGALQS